MAKWFNSDPTKGLVNMFSGAKPLTSDEVRQRSIELIEAEVRAAATMKAEAGREKMIKMMSDLGADDYMIVDLLKTQQQSLDQAMASSLPQYIKAYGLLDAVEEMRPGLYQSAGQQRDPLLEGSETMFSPQSGRVRDPLLEGSETMLSPQSGQVEVMLATGNPRVRLQMMARVANNAFAADISIEQSLGEVNMADQFTFSKQEMETMYSDLNGKVTADQEEKWIKAISERLGNADYWNHGVAYILKLVKEILARDEMPITRKVMALYNNGQTKIEDRIEASFIRDELQRAHDETVQAGFLVPDDVFTALTVLKITLNWSGLPFQPAYMQKMAPHIRAIAKRVHVPNSLIRTFEALLLQ